MLNENRNDQNNGRVNSSKASLVKEWVLFFGELVKASVEGIAEFWGKSEETKPVEVASVAVETADVVEETEEVEETAEEIDELVEEYEAEAAAAEQARVCAKELRQQAKKIKKMAKRARREEHRVKKCEKKLAKQEKKAIKAENKQEKKVVKAENKQKKVKAKSGYVSKSMILSETEKRFYDGIKNAVGLRYVVKPRVEMADLLKRGDGTKCKDEQLGEMDFGVFDLQLRLKVLVEIRGLKRRGKQKQKVYKKVRKICKKAGIPVVTFWAKYGVLPEYIRERMQDYLNV